MRDLAPLITILAALYHESGRQSVAIGATLAHSVGQARPFTEYADLRHEARLGRELTAEMLLGRFEFGSLPRAEGLEPTTPYVDALAEAIHECERPAIDRGWTVIQLDPPHPWIPFSDLPPQAQEGRRNQARYFLARFDVRALAGA